MYCFELAVCTASIHDDLFRVKLGARSTNERLVGMADWMLSELALSRECLLALAYCGFPSLMWLDQNHNIQLLPQA